MSDFIKRKLCRLVHLGKWEEKPYGWQCSKCGSLWVSPEFSRAVKEAQARARHQA